MTLETLYHTHPDVKSPFNQVKFPVRPGGVLLVSPYTGEAGLPSEEGNTSTDYISKATGEKVSEYLPHTKDSIPFSYCAKDVSYKSILPRNVVVTVGGKEVLLDAGLEFAKRCRQDNLKVTLVREENVHNYFMLGYLFTGDPTVVKRAVSTVVDLAQTVADAYREEK